MANDSAGATNFPEASVYNRYAAAAHSREQALCCPVEYAADFLSGIPDEILEKDYGCGDPTPYAREGETVLDLGAGGGKLCYILAQVVGHQGRVIGVDCNREMLTLARKYQQPVAERLGFSNVDFRYGLIQDLRLDLDLLGRELTQHPVRDPASWLVLRNLEERLRREQPMIADDTVDCVGLGLASDQPRHIRDLDERAIANLRTREIVTGRHCFGCTAGAGSSCGGQLRG